MSKQTTPWPDTVNNTVLEALANHRRRRVLRVLKNEGRTSLEDVATRLVAQETGTALLDVTRSDVEKVLGELAALHLPRLTEVGLVDRQDQTVTITEHPALQDPKVEPLLEPDTPEWDTVLDCLANEYRRVTLTTLIRNGGVMKRRQLAAEVTTMVHGDDDDDVVERVLRDLHHCHLPKLAEAGLVWYEIDKKMVGYEGHHNLNDEWLVADAEDTPRPILSMAEQSKEMWTLHGRENVTERGRSLCEQADDELFMMFTLRDTVETACVHRIQDAIDRGVDVYLGTQNRQLRDLVREHTPEVTIWEPQLDWLNLPPNHEKVGLLIMTDREKIMVGTIGEDGPNGRPHETAITGEGVDNPLVMLLREMLGSRLDHLDAQSEDFLEQIPL